MHVNGLISQLHWLQYRLNNLDELIFTSEHNYLTTNGAQNDFHIFAYTYTNPGMFEGI